MSNETVQPNVPQQQGKTTPQNQRQELGALWKKEGRNQTYLTGYVTTADGKRLNVVVFSSKQKKNERQPDYRIYESIDNKPASETQPTRTAENSDKQVAASEPPAQERARKANAEDADEELL